MSKLALAWQSARDGGWCSKLSCTTCPREQWARALWAISQGVSPIYRRTEVILPSVMEELAPRCIHGSHPSLVQQWVLLEELRLLPIEYFSSRFPRWGMYVGLIMSFTEGLDAQDRSASRCVAGRLLELVEPQGRYSSRLDQIRSGRDRMELRELWEVAADIEARHRPLA